MPFNWFNRQFGGKKDDQSQQDAPKPQEAKSSPEKVESNPPQTKQSETKTEDTAPANAEDYLKWAKAAYQNIQKQQTEEASPEKPEADATETETETVSDAEVETEIKAKAEVEVETGTKEEAKAVADPAAPVPESNDSVIPASSTPESTISEDTLVAPTGEPDTDASADETTVAPETVADAAPSESASTEQSDDITSSSPSIEDTVSESSDTEDEPELAEISSTATDVTESDAPKIDSVDDSGDALEDSPLEPDGIDPDDDDDDDDAAEAKEAAEAKDVEDAEEAEASPVLPFWAKAEAERQERLEKLKETAIEEPEEPEVELDEDFVWSAGVLASQGRRAEEVSMEEITWLTKLRQGLGKTRRGLINELKAVVGQGPLNADAIVEIESLLIQADVGIDATDYVIEALQARMKEGALPPEEAIAYLKEILRGILDKPFESEYEQDFVPEKDCLNIWLLTGVNGAGKTTTIGKLAHMTRTSDYRCLIAAADTFRAAAVEQVKVWGERSGVEVIANPGKNTDPAAVVFDAISAAQARDVELLLVDTAGRLQNKKNLMDELSKIRRIVDKKAATAQVESLLVLDATLGQNGLRQAQVFSEAAKLSGVVLTKLDGSAKGGVALAVVQQLGLPIRFIGAGEGIEDLRPFSSYEFVEALLSG